jgi:hypothetical protein
VYAKLIVISSTEYVRMKKYNESFNFSCVSVWGGGIIVSAPENLEPQPKRKRGRPVSNLIRKYSHWSSG